MTIKGLGADIKNKQFNRPSLSPNVINNSDTRRQSLKMGLASLHIPKKSADLMNKDGVISPALALGSGLSPTIQKKINKAERKSVFKPEMKATLRVSNSPQASRFKNEN